MGAPRKLHVPREVQKKHYDMDSGDVLEIVMVMPGKKMKWKNPKTGKYIDPSKIEIK